MKRRKSLDFKIECPRCGVIQPINKSNIKTYKISKKELQELEKKKQIIEEKYQEFLELSKNKGFFKSIWYFLFDWDNSFYLGKDFDMWLFVKYPDIGGGMKFDVDVIDKNFKYWKCQFCGGFNRL